MPPGSIRPRPKSTSTPPRLIPDQPVWEAGFTIPAGGTDYLIENRNFRNTSTAALFTLPTNGRKVILKNCNIETRGPVCTGFRNKLEIEDTLITMLPATVSGTAPARLLNLDEVKHLVFRNNTVLECGGGIYLSGLPDGSGNKFWLGVYADGDRIIIEKNIVYNPMGQYSDGSGGVIKSNWGTTHSSGAVGASVRGWTVANFVQMNGMPECPYYVGYNFIFSTLGKSRAEDVVSGYGGTGGISMAIPAIVEHNVIVTSGGFDWNFVPGTSTVYNPSNQITTNAVAGQDINQTRYSGTAQIMGDGIRTDLWEANSNYTISRYNLAFGPRPFITTQGGNSSYMIGNEMYWLDRHPTGTLYTGYTEGLYQWSEVVADATAPKRGTGTPTAIWGGHAFRQNVLFQSGLGADTTLAVPASVIKNGNASLSFGNLKKIGPTDGGAARIKQWIAQVTGAGIVLGRRTV